MIRGEKGVLHWKHWGGGFNVEGCDDDRGFQTESVWSNASSHNRSMASDPPCSVYNVLKM